MCVFSLIRLSMRRPSRCRRCWNLIQLKLAWKQLRMHFGSVCASHINSNICSINVVHTAISHHAISVSSETQACSFICNLMLLLLATVELQLLLFCYIQRFRFLLGYFSSAMRLRGNTVRHLQKLAIDFLIASCCSSSHIIRSPIFGCSLVADSDCYLHNIMTYNMTLLLT